MGGTNSEYDVIVVGAGPAGCAAGIAAVRQDLRTLLVHRNEKPGAGTCAGWAGPAAAELCKTCGANVPAIGTAVRGLALHSWDFDQSTEVDDAELSGFVVDPAALTQALRDATSAAGATITPGVQVEMLTLGEQYAAMRLSDGREVSGRIVLLADGATSPTSSAAQLDAVRRVPRHARAAVAVWSGKTDAASLRVVLGTGREVDMAVITQGGGTVRITLRSPTLDASPVEKLEAFIPAAREAGVLPATFEARAVEIPCLDGSALEMETHVGKRCLLIGDAGGYVASFSSDGLYPALRSGWLAGETAARALAAPVLQDELATFSPAWRGDLGEYLRMPNTDLGLLMPMVFKNPRMSQRVARAFMLGEAF